MKKQRKRERNYWKEEKRSGKRSGDNCKKTKKKKKVEMGKQWEMRKGKGERQERDEET